MCRFFLSFALIQSSFFGAFVMFVCDVCGVGRLVDYENVVVCMCASFRDFKAAVSTIDIYGSVVCISEDDITMKSADIDILGRANSVQCVPRLERTFGECAHTETMRKCLSATTNGHKVHLGHIACIPSFVYWNVVRTTEREKTSGCMNVVWRDV